METANRFRWLSLLPTLLLAGCAALRPSEKEPAPPSYAGPDQIALAALPAGSIAIDGDLSEWQEVPPIFLAPRWDTVSGQVADDAHPDRALFRLARDHRALYAALRVVDEEVVNPYEDSQMWKGDALELFLDVRPQGAQEDTTALGARRYTSGCYQLFFAPVSPDGDQARWHCVQQGEDAPREMEVAAQLLADGYALEIRIPFAQLAGSAAERFARPIGVDVMVDDIAGSAPTHLIQYAWSGKAGSWNNATNFGRTASFSPGDGWSELVRFVPPCYHAGTRSFVAAAILPLHRRHTPAEIDLRFQYAGSAFDRPADQAQWEVTAPAARPAAVDSDRTWSDSALGLQFTERALLMEDLIGGRYLVTSRFRGMTDTVRAYYQESSEGGRMETVATLLSAEELSRAIAGRLSLWTDRYHLFDADSIRVSAGAWLGGGLLWGLSEQGGAAGYQLRLEISAAGPPQVLVRMDSLPFRREDMHFSVPLDGLDDKPHLVRATLIDSDGSSFPARRQWDTGTYAPTIFLRAHRGRDFRLHTVLDTASVLLTRAVSVGDPNRSSFPADDALHCYARSIWDLHRYEGRIYTGCGDWQDNQGPIDIFSFSPPAPGDSLSLAYEFTVDDESVDIIRDMEGRLLVPGTDSREPWELGNLYIKEAGKWQKLRTIPNGLHAFDAAFLDGKLYATAGTESGAALYESTDWGQTWKRYSGDGAGEFMDGRYREMAIVGGKLLVTASTGAQYAYRLDGDRLTRLVIPLFPKVETRRGYLLPYRLTSTPCGALYTLRTWEREERPRPLFFLDDLENGALLVELFEDTHVQDILVRGDAVFVLTSSPAGEEYSGALYRSRDMKKWTQIARFITPAQARSLEELDGQFYLGLACHQEEALPASGQICRLE